MVNRITTPSGLPSRKPAEFAEWVGILYECGNKCQINGEWSHLLLWTSPAVNQPSTQWRKNILYDGGSKCLRLSNVEQSHLRSGSCNRTPAEFPQKVGIHLATSCRQPLNSRWLSRVDGGITCQSMVNGATSPSGSKAENQPSYQRS